MSYELSKTHADKTVSGSDRRRLKDRNINKCDCEQLLLDFSEKRAKYQHKHGRTYYDYRTEIEESIKRDHKSFFECVDQIKTCWVSFNDEMRANLRLLLRIFAVYG
jgi:hypothetical protein